MQLDVELLDRHCGDFVPARIIECIDVAYAKRTDGQWLTFVTAEQARATAAGKSLPVPQHSHWQWEKKVAMTAHLLPYPTLSIEHEGTAQGLMLLQTDGEYARLPEEKGKPLVHVHFLASAPWNLPAIVARPRFKGVGTLLVRAAIETSIDLGFKGRLSLHSLPQADNFYKQIGMTLLGPDAKKQNLNYYEMSPAQASEFLR